MMRHDFCSRDRRAFFGRTVFCTTGIMVFVIGCHPEEKSSFGVDAPPFSAAVLSPEPEHVNAIWAGAGIIDYDNDGWMDIFIPNGTNTPDALYKNMHDGTFEDVAEEAGVASLKANGGVLIADFDNDGDSDMMVNTVCSTGTWSDDEHVIDPAGGLMDGNKILYENLGDGRFLEKNFALPSTDIQFLERCTVSMTAGDMNNDGFVDVILSNGHDADVATPWIFSKHAQTSKNVVLYNDGTGNFSRAWEDDTSYTTFTSIVFDLNQDGWLDIIAAQGGGNIDYFINNQDETFQRDTEQTNSLNGLWMGLAMADYNRDGVLDLFATNQGLSPYMAGYDNTSAYFSDIAPSPSSTPAYIYQSIHLGVLENATQSFAAPSNPPIENPYTLPGDMCVEHSYAILELYPDWWYPENLQRYGWSWGAAALDADGDGWMDISFIGNNGTAPLDIIGDVQHGAGYGSLLLSREDFSFVDVAMESGVANLEPNGQYLDGRGVAIGDVNNDGFSDIVYSNRTYTPSLSNPLAQHPGHTKVWLSGERDTNWIGITLEGIQSNRDAQGSIVWIEHDEETRIYPYAVGGQTCSSSDTRLHVGLNDWTTINIRVRFPNGNARYLENVETNQHITITEW